jgi:hypothetical protein
LFSRLSKIVKIKIYRTIILPVVLYAFETWSLTLREEHRLRVFENRVLRRILGQKRDEVTGGCRKLLTELVLFGKYNLNDQVKGGEMGSGCSTKGVEDECI